MEKVKINFEPEAEKTYLQFGLTKERVDDLMRPAMKKIMDMIIHEDGEGTDIGKALMAGLEDCETTGEIVFVTFACTRFLEEMKDNPMAKVLTALGRLIEKD